MIIVSNTGPILHLQEAKCLDLLQLAGDTNIPQAVASEIAYLQTEWTRPDWIKVVNLEETSHKQAHEWVQADLLDRGEADALSLALHLKAHWFLTDDSAARLLGNMLGIEVHGSLGIVLWAAAKGFREHAQAKADLENLVRSSLWMSMKVIEDARRVLDNILNE
jgi:predicted nucleic acid-binding protein